MVELSKPPILVAKSIDEHECGVNFYAAFFCWFNHCVTCGSTPKLLSPEAQILGPIDPVLPEHANRGTVGGSGGCFRSTFFVRSSKGQLS